MIKDELIDKKGLCHFLLYSTANPEVLIPAKGIVEDIHFEEDIPHYSIKLIKFYDNINFLKEHFIGKPFLLKHKGKSKAIPIPKTNNVVEMQNWFLDECVHRFCVESTFVVRSKSDMVELFNKIQEYLIAKNLRLLRDTTMRSLYEGPLKLQSKVEFVNRLERMYGDRFKLGEFPGYAEFI